MAQGKLEKGQIVSETWFAAVVKVLADWSTLEESELERTKKLWGNNEELELDRTTDQHHELANSGVQIVRHHIKRQKPASSLVRGTFVHPTLDHHPHARQVKSSDIPDHETAGGINDQHMGYYGHRRN